MADEKKNGRTNGGMTCDCMSGCSCGCHQGGGRHWTFFLLRTLLTIIILMVVFWFGVAASRVGEYNRSNAMPMYTRGMYGYGTGGAMPMLRTNDATSTAPATGGVENY